MDHHHQQQWRMVDANQVPALAAADTYTATVTSGRRFRYCQRRITFSFSSSGYRPATPTISLTTIANTPYTDTNTVVPWCGDYVTTDSKCVCTSIALLLPRSQTLSTTGSQKQEHCFFAALLIRERYCQSHAQNAAASAEKTLCRNQHGSCTSPGAPSISPYIVDHLLPVKLLPIRYRM